MTYDGENQMTGYNVSVYSYDGNGLRVVKSSSGTSTVSIYSGSSVIAEYDNGAAPSAPSREYVYNGAGDTTGLLAMISGGATTYYHQDHLGVRLTTDANGNVLSQQGTFPYGESWYQSGTGNKFVFTSYERDSESGLDYALARYYNSGSGTFLMADPVAGNPGDPQSWNRYPYGRNDPINITDPSGQSWWSKLLIDVGIGIASYFLGPAIDSFFGLEGDAAVSAYGDSGFISAESYADSVANSVPSGIPGLFARTGAGVATSVAGEGAAGSGGSLVAGFIGAGAAQASDQQKTAPNNVNKQYGATIPCGSSAGQVMGAVESNFAAFGNYSAGPFSLAFHQPPQMGAGSEIPITAGYFGVSQNMGVSVASMSSQSMTFNTLPGGHLFYPGSISFSASPAGNGSINFNINLSGTFNGVFNGAKYYLGGAAFENAQWNHFLGKVKAYCSLGG
jgi:RHS repeat-associated protein